MITVIGHLHVGEESAVWEGASNNVEEEEEDLHKREEELQAELMMATKRCQELKQTLQETKSFMDARGLTKQQVPDPRSATKGARGAAGGVAAATIQSEIEEEEEEDDDTFDYEDEDYEDEDNEVIGFDFPRWCLSLHCVLARAEVFR